MEIKVKTQFHRNSLRAWLMEEAVNHASSYAGDYHVVMYANPNDMFDAYNDNEFLLKNKNVKTYHDTGIYGYETIDISFQNHSQIEMMWCSDYYEMTSCINHFFHKGYLSPFTRKYAYVNDIELYHTNSYASSSSYVSSRFFGKQLQTTSYLDDLFISGCCCPQECNEACFDLDDERCEVDGFDMKMDYGAFKKEYAEMDFGLLLESMFPFIKDMMFMNGRNIVTLENKKYECCEGCDKKTKGCICLDKILAVNKKCPWYTEMLVQSLN